MTNTAITTEGIAEDISTAEDSEADVPVHAHVRVPAPEAEEQDALLRTSMVQKSVQQGSEQDLRSDRKTVFIPFYMPI